jgi:hypothetical protein
MGGVTRHYGSAKGIGHGALHVHAFPEPIATSLVLLIPSLHGTAARPPPPPPAAGGL